MPVETPGAETGGDVVAGGAPPSAQPMVTANGRPRAMMPTNRDRGVRDRGERRTPEHRDPGAKGYAPDEGNTERLINIAGGQVAGGQVPPAVRRR
jgi:hypothetical protein